MLESDFKKYAKRKIATRIPGIDFIDTKPFSRSMPDTFVIGPKVWAALEWKQSKNAPHRPNQDHHIERLNEQGFARFVFPENLEEVLDELEVLFLS